jgi:hypothetical protein
MGGFGSGRRSSRRCTDEMLRLDIREIQRRRLLVPGGSLTLQWFVGDDTTASMKVAIGEGFAVFSYERRERNDTWRPVKCPVPLAWTRCHYGGLRAWWRCPSEGCNRRVAVLYGGLDFRCRHCHHLAYRCQREAKGDRALRRASRIRRRLGREQAILGGYADRPKGMHRNTFDRLVIDHDGAVEAALTECLR